MVDVAEVFLWLMAVGTVLCASYWSAWSAREAAVEMDKLLKVGLFEVHHNLLSSIFEERWFPYGILMVDVNLAGWL